MIKKIFTKKKALYTFTKQLKKSMFVFCVCICCVCVYKCGSEKVEDEEDINLNNKFINFTSFF